MKYTELKKKHSDEFGDFKGIFYAFNDKQFNEGMEKIGLLKNEKDKIYSIGFGGFILKERNDEFVDMISRHSKELYSMLEDKDFLLDALVYELINHEYCISYDANTALYVLGLSSESVDKDILKEACRKSLERS